MLRTRVITAVAIVALLVPAIFFLDRTTWAILTAMITGLGAWEFARLAGFCPAGQVRYGVFVGALAIVATAFVPPEIFPALETLLLSISAVFWVFIVPFWLRTRCQVRQHWLMALVGLAILLPTWLSLITLRDFGPLWLLGSVLMVALADIAAYFFGRAFGKRKLAPNISPGKTWEGAWGAMATVTALGALLLVLSGTADAVRLAAVLVAMPALALVSIAGDLFESMLKRQAGLKDSSNLLPGHGGVLDRIDSHTAALPLVSLLLILFR
jgi:phosphatidate cytidylyltransferase